MEVKTRNSVLDMASPYFTLPCTITNEGVTETSGKKIIKAGTPVGGDDNVLKDGTKKLKVTNTSTLGAKSQGVVIEDVDVTDGDTSATVAFMGVIDLGKMESTVTVDSAVKFPYPIIYVKRRAF